MRRIILGLVVCFVALQSAATEAGALDPQETSITCDSVGGHTARLYQVLLGRPADLDGLGYWVHQQWDNDVDLTDVAYWMSQGTEFRLRYGWMDDETYIDALYRNVLGRPADPAGKAYWLDQLRFHGRHRLAVWFTISPELGARRPLAHSPMCGKAQLFGLNEVRPGMAVSRGGSTVVVVADRDLVHFGAVDGGRTYASSIDGDVVVNANWFTGAGPEAPVVVDGRRTGSEDIVERGQIVSYRPGCGGRPDRPGIRSELEHIWMGQLYRPGPCVETAVSGMSLIHKGRRADAFPGVTLTGYTHTSRAHSFIGFNDREIVIISTTQMTSPQLADLALQLGVTEGILLDGGGSTQIATPTASIGSSRAVPTFAVLNSVAGR